MTDNHDHTCKVFHFDLFGTRKEKYDFLNSHRLEDVDWAKLQPQAPQYFFVPKDFSAQEEYEKGFKVDELMGVNAAGVKTHHDSELISTNPFDSKNNQPYAYRVLDNQWINYDLSKVERHRFVLMKHLMVPNLALSVSRQCVSDWHYVFVSKFITDINFIASAGKLGGGNVFPLYLYTEDGNERVPNLNKEIWHKIKNIVGQVTPEQIFDYIYGVLHTPSYRTKYKEFLKVDFPRIPYPTSKDEFDRIADIGTQLRKLHLMESVPSMPDIAQFTTSGDNLVEKLAYKEGCVFFNDAQCFSNVPEVSWNFYIGGYQPAQKWLKDRKGRNLTFDDILHYRNIIIVLLETDRLMKALDNLLQ